MSTSRKFRRCCAILIAALSLLTFLPAPGMSALPLPPGPPQSAETSLLPSAFDAPSGGSNGPDAILQVPWNGTYWQSMPNFTWAACDVSRNTRRAIDIAIGQWSYAGANQGIPIRLSEVS